MKTNIRFYTLVFFATMLLSVNQVRCQTITTGTISGSPFCFGNVVDVPFTITGTFTAGNIFTAVLSNAAGSFASGTTNIGTLTSTSAGTINATLPSLGASSALYRIEVVSSNPSITGSMNTVNITINTISTGTSFTVTNTNASGAGSLSQAITNANTNANTKDTIKFYISGTPPFTITLSSALPSLTDNAGVVIDGTTQPNNGFTGVSPKIILNDNATTNGVGIDLQGQNSEVYGLYFRNFGINGYAINVGTSNTAAGSNFIVGASGKGNVMNTGTTNSTGINIASGVYGGTIQANKIGTDTSGTVAGHLDYGIELDGANVLVGGTTSGEGNLISGNGLNMHITGSYNSIYGNTIGPDINDNYLAASSNGIYIFTGAGHNTIGGSLPGEPNIIAYNYLTVSTGGGIEIQSSNNNLISRNSIYCNGGWGGIQLIGGNNSYASPVIVSSNTAGATGTSAANAIIELFYNHSGCTPTATVGCEGETYIGTTTANASGNWTYTGTLIAGKALVATATDNLNNTAAFSNCTVTVVSALPVELLYFSGHNENMINVLTWSTATEINNDYFTIEKSENGIDFISIATVKGAGNSTSTNTYSYIDDSPNKGVQYYRLSQTDYDGKRQLFNTIALDAVNTGKISIYPNPLKESMPLLINVSLDYADSINLYMYSYDGKLVYSSSSVLNKGPHQIKIENNTLSAGVYFIHVLDNNVNWVGKLVKE